MPLKRKKLFVRELDQCSPASSPEVLAKKDHTFVHQPPLQNRRLTRSINQQKPTCLVFGPFRETIYSDFFCRNCKMYEDALMSGNHNRINRDYHHHCCTANHTSYFFPTHRLEILHFKKTSSLNFNSEMATDNLVGSHPKENHPRITLQSSEAPPTSYEDDDAFNTLAYAYYCLEKLCELSWM
jgi:hypothetical protein